MDAIALDLRYAVRTLLRSPGFALVAVLTIAIGVGANTAIFSIVNAVLIRPLPYPRADELVLVAQNNRQTKHKLADATPANFLDWRARSHAFAGLAAFEPTALILCGTDRPERINGAMVSANFFDMLGVTAARGRAFAPSDEQHGASRVVVVSDGLWRRRFGGRADVLGATVPVNSEPSTIVGVMPPGVDYPDKAEAWHRRDN